MLLSKKILFFGTKIPFISGFNPSTTRLLLESCSRYICLRLPMMRTPLAWLKHAKIVARTIKCHMT